MKLRLKSARELGGKLLSAARRHPDEVEEYLDEHAEEWEALAEAAPGDAADILEALGEEVAGELIADLEAEQAVEVLEELRPDLAADLLEELPSADAARLLEQMLPEEAADVLGEVEEEAVEALLDLMEPEAADELRQLLVYPVDSAGGLMTTDVAVLPVGLTAGEAIERVRQLHDELEELSYVYVVDDDGRLVGVLSFRDLVFARPATGLDETMVRHPVAVAATTDREEVADLVQRYHLFGVPVVDDDGRLLGMVTSDVVIQAVEEEASEDFAVAVGAGVDETVRSPVTKSIRRRLPWILFDVAMSALVVVAISRFSEVLSAFTVLAALMPLVARVGGDAGAQSLAVVIRGLAIDDIPLSSARPVIGREMAVGAINGVAVGVLSGVLGYAMQTLTGGDQAVRIGLVMMVAAIANLVVAGAAGAGIPLALRRLGLDPALASNLFLTTVTDLIGFAGFLAIATALL